MFLVAGDEDFQVENHNLTIHKSQYYQIESSHVYYGHLEVS